MNGRLVTAAALLFTLHATAIAAQTLTVRQFTERIDALAKAVAETDSAAAVRLAPSVHAVERVSAAGATYDVPLDWVRTALETAPSAASWPEQRQRLVQRLAVVSDEAGKLESGAAPDGSPRRALDEVFAAGRFERVRHTPWQAALMERFQRWLNDLLFRAARRGWSGRRIGQAVAWTVSAAALIVLIVWLTRLSLQRRADRPVGVGPVGAIVPPGHVLGAEAAELIRAGRLREGARAAYRAALRRLEEEGVLRLDPSNTPRETLRLVAPSHRRAAPLRALTAVFERIWYGSRPAGDDEASRLLGLLRELECLPSDRAK